MILANIALDAKDLRLFLPEGAKNIASYSWWHWLYPKKDLTSKHGTWLNYLPWPKGTNTHFPARTRLLICSQGGGISSLQLQPLSAPASRLHVCAAHKRNDGFLPSTSLSKPTSTSPLKTLEKTHHFQCFSVCSAPPAAFLMRGPLFLMDPRQLPELPLIYRYFCTTAKMPAQCVH